MEGGEMGKIRQMLLSHDIEMRQLGLTLLIQEDINIIEKHRILDNCISIFHSGTDWRSGPIEWFWNDDMAMKWNKMRVDNNFNYSKGRWI